MSRGWKRKSLAIDLLLAGKDIQSVGEVRITTVDSIAEAVLAPLLPSFAEKHPGITLELVTDHQTANLSRREADIALRPRRTTRAIRWSDGVLGS